MIRRGRRKGGRQPASLAGTRLVRDPRTGMYHYRYTDRATGRRRKKTTGKTTLEEARRVARQLERDRLAGRPNLDRWKKELEPLAEKWLEHEATKDRAPLDKTIETKRTRIMRALRVLRLRTTGDLRAVARIDDRARRYGRKHGWLNSRLRRCIQEPLQQFSRWLAGNHRHLRRDPLSDWEPMGARNAITKIRRSFAPDLVARGLIALDALDVIQRRKFPLRPVFEALFVTAPRSGVMLSRRVEDFVRDGRRIDMGKSVRNKRRGAGALDATTAAIVERYVGDRKTGLLFLSPTGAPLSLEKFLDYWREAVGLGTVSALWPSDAPRSLQLAYLVNLALRSGRVRVSRGGNPKLVSPETVLLRLDAERRVAAIVECIREKWQEEMALVDVHSVRKTHRTWAKKLKRVPATCIDAQLGHETWSSENATALERAARGSETGERYYTDQDLDLLYENPWRSANAVREVLDEALARVTVVWTTRAVHTSPETSEGPRAALATPREPSTS